QRQTGAHGCESANELYRNHVEGGGLDFPAEHGFHALYAAAFGGRGELNDEQTCQPCSRGPDDYRQQPADMRPPMRPGDQLAAVNIGFDQTIAKRAPDNPDQEPTQYAGTHDADHARIQEGREHGSPMAGARPFYA